MYLCYLCCSYICVAGYVAFFSVNSTGRGPIRSFISLLRESRGVDYDLSFGISNIIIFSSREYIDFRKQVLDTAFSYESDGKIVLFKSIKQESISFLSEDLKKDWMFHKVKTGEKDGYGSDEMLSAPRIYLEMMSRKTEVPYSSIL